MGFPFLKDFASISKRLVAFRSSARTTSPTHVVSRTRETSPEGVACFPFASQSPEAPARGRPPPASLHQRNHRFLSHPYWVPPDQSQDNLEISKRNMLSSASPLKSRWPPLIIISVDRRLPHIVSPLLMLPPLVLIQQRCVDPCPGRFRSPSHDSSRTIDAYSSHHCFSRRSHERYDQRVAYSDAPAHWRRPLSRESPPSRHLDFTSKSLSHLRGASPHGGPRRLRRGASPSQKCV